jgi:hypothetical protein
VNRDLSTFQTNRRHNLTVILMDGHEFSLISETMPQYEGEFVIAFSG